MIATRGILRPKAGFEHFQLDRVAPPADLASYLDALWTVTWELPEGAEFEQEILPFPCVNLACEEGDFRVHGPGTARFVARLRGRGWVAGVRFRAASFSPFASCPMRALLDRVAPAGDVMSRPPPAAPQEPRLAREALLSFVRSFELPAAAPTLEQINALVDRAQTDRAIAKAEDLAQAAGMSVRSLHRTLERYVGVSSKWIVRRARIQECADRVANGEPLDWARVSQDLGYHDQSHLIRDFKAQIGHTPTAYAAQCRSGE